MHTESIYSSIYEKLIKDGYHIGTIDEMFNELTGIDKNEFEKWSKIFRGTQSDKFDNYLYRHNYIAQNNPNSYLKNPNYTGPIPTDEEFKQEVSYLNKDARKDFVKNVILGGGDIRTTQQWGRLCLESYDETEKESTIDTMDAFFNDAIRKHTSLIYPELMAKKDTFKLATQYSMYEAGDFSEIHFDGINPGRACVIIIYFAEPETWNEGDGGELFLGHSLKMNNINALEFDGEYKYCKPTYGNYAIMDFTKFNIGHSIELVKNNFVRFALQSFVGP
jgi:Rps23 Pro-64 3,4-dihydroxylase Tpa1-like proline 4-hydroxylase